MALKDKYPNLPGILSEFKDGGLQLKADPNPPKTDSILILGTAIDGPINEPVAVDPETVELVFGPALTPNRQPNGSTLVRAFEEAYMAGCRDIRLMRITGSKASTIVKGEVFTKTFEKPFNQEMIAVVIGNKTDAAQGIFNKFDLNSVDIDASSVEVTIAGQPVSPTDFTVVNGTSGATPTFASVELADGVASAGRAVYITYRDASGTLHTENGHEFTDGTVEYWKTKAPMQDVTLADNPKAGTLHVYANGIEIDDSSFTVSGDVVSLDPAKLTMGDIIDATFLAVVTETNTPEMKIEAVYGGRVYNDTVVEVVDIEVGGSVVGKKVLIHKPESKKAQDAEKPLEFTSVDFANYDLMVSAINRHPKNNVVRAAVSEDYKYLQTSGLDSSKPEQFLIGGDDGVHVSTYDLFQALGGVKDASGNVIEPGAYQLLENYNTDFIVPAGVFVDDVLPGKYDNFGYQLALACAVISHRNDTVIGVIGTKSPDEAGLKAIRDHAEHLLSLNNNYFMRDRAGNVLRGADGKPIDLGRFINVIAGPDLLFSSPRLGNYSALSPAAYAGQLSEMEPQNAPTNKPIKYAAGMRFGFSNSQLDKLTASRFVTYKYKNNGAQVAVTDAMTAAQSTSDYRRLNTVRVVKSVVDAVRKVSDPFIGQPNEEAQRNALSSAIDKELTNLKEAGVLSDFDFNMVANPQDILLGQLKIELTLVPPQELRRITTVVSLKPSL